MAPSRRRAQPLSIVTPLQQTHHVFLAEMHKRLHADEPPLVFTSAGSAADKHRSEEATPRGFRSGAAGQAARW